MKKKIARKAIKIHSIEKLKSRLSMAQSAWLVIKFVLTKEKVPEESDKQFRYLIIRLNYGLSPAESVIYNLIQLFVY